jgi:hypothetical protein
VTRELHLCDLLDRAEVRAPTPAHVELQYMEVGGVESPAIFQHPDSEIRLPLPAKLERGRLRLGLGIRSSAWERLAAPVRFRVGVDVGGAVAWVLERTLDPRKRELDRRWIEETLALPRARAVVLETRAAEGGHAWAGWMDPVLEYAPRTRASRPRPEPREHVFLVTADACRADVLGCHGGQAHTPHLDALAADGVRFAHARSASTATPASYASLLTGMSPPRHGLVAEWGAFPAHLPSLPTELARNGCRTVFAPSERDLSDSGQGFSRVFAETVACLGNPSQEAPVTTRRLLRRLDERGGERLFAWMQFFDTHPPHRVDDHLLRLYYDGDPRDPTRAWRQEAVQAIYGVESVLMFDAALPFLREGAVPARIADRIGDTGRAIRGDIESGPDLADHLVALGPAARRGMEPTDFAAWLMDRARSLESGRVEPELLDWLDEVLPLLREVERDITTWVEGVVDYRYPVARALASVTLVDAQLGALVEYLKEQELYDQATLVFCSPHGQLYGENGYHFHHHAALEPTVRIPLIVKPPAAARIEARVVDGVFDAIDLLPTLLELLDMPAPASCEGRSRLHEVRTGRPIPEHESFTLAAAALEACVARPPARINRALALHSRPDGGVVEVGATGHFDIAEGEHPADPSPDAAALAERLEEWLAPLNGRAAE